MLQCFFLTFFDRTNVFDSLRVCFGFEQKKIAPKNSWTYWHRWERPFIEFILPASHWRAEDNWNPFASSNICAIAYVWFCSYSFETIVGVHRCRSFKLSSAHWYLEWARLPIAVWYIDDSMPYSSSSPNWHIAAHTRTSEYFDPSTESLANSKIVSSEKKRKRAHGAISQSFDNRNGNKFRRRHCFISRWITRTANRSQNQSALWNSFVHRLDPWSACA